MNRRFRSGGIHSGATLAVLAVLGLLFASGAQAHVLSKTRAVSAARNAASVLARKQAGDATQPTYSGPSCTRRSRHRFVCSTTVSGTASCDPVETACESVPWELSYVITVKFRSANSNALSVSTVEA